MKINKSVKFSALFFLIFILGIIFFVASINESLEKKTQFIQKVQTTNNHSVASSLRE